MDKDVEDNKKILPSQFMRGRRPHLFSDSTEIEEVAISREVLSHHLETLTKQKDEVPFERFARRLAQKFIAPNMRPQTGPTGGGDGKTDAESYPVSAEVAARWYIADPANADGRMAFAFSAKAKWRPKVQDDVGEIAGTGRDYKRIYFITNQFVPAKDSAEVQDALNEKWGIPIIILDRTWLLDRVFEDKSMDIAIDTLGLGDASRRAIRVLGPKDYERLQELGEIEDRLADANSYQGAPHQLIEDAHRAAILSRGLGYPRHETDGRFQRAIRLARQHNLPHLELGAVYDQAWTTNFWFDDFAEFSRLYDEVERLAIDSDTVDDIERVSNLLGPLRTVTALGELQPELAKLDSRTDNLRQALTRLKEDASRPNNAHQAHAMLLMLQLTEVAHEEDSGDLTPIWNEFRDLIIAAEGLGFFPFESVADILSELGGFVPESQAFDELYEVLTDALAKRRSEGEAAKRNSQRGFQKLEKNLPYEAIRWFGRAVSLLVKDEYRDELVQALVGSSFAYDKAGLLWAAYLYASSAVAHELARFKKTGSLDEVHPVNLSRWMVLELALGRLPFALSAFELDTMVRNGRATTDKQRENLQQRRLDFTMWFGGLLLRSRFSDLAQVGKLPDILERLGLGEARMALLYLMGRQDVLRQEGSIPAEETDNEVEKHFQGWFSFGRQLELPDHPDYMLADRVDLKSHVIGCDIVIDCANNLTSLAVAGSLLGALEALLATSLSHPIFPMLDRLNVRVDPDIAAGIAPTLELVEENGQTVGVIRHRAQLTFKDRTEAISFPQWLHEAVLTVFTTFAMPRDLETWADTVFKNESGFDRAITFSNLPSTYSIIYGNTVRLSILDRKEESDVDYAMGRFAPWVPDDETEPEEEKIAKPRFMGVRPPDGMFNPEHGKHTNVRVISPIDVRKWDGADWSGAFFMISPGNPHFPPVLGLMFGNGEVGEAIFRGLRGRFGFDDPDDALRVAIIRGARISNSHAYAVSVGPNRDKIEYKKGETVGFLSRYNLMTPTTSENLERFLAAYREHGRYLLAPALLKDPGKPPDPILELGIGKYALHVKEAWTIAPGDDDASVLDLDDPPFVPLDEADPPAIKAMELLASFRRKGPS
ncbi:hypothetical protein [Mesorhizobium kowhaii]|uniref:Uncharacterized protein n=1 Tax=Mesorhizobium kowhaii TaxID=1300272 RepID=A0A2W7BSZ6_9HYPH|nr:hypothetical protein [Mesorhizobium kowhaii]PZV33965.1 hypothetical protein B5V02_35125 [Mesorhizobium kowhaii]